MRSRVDKLRWGLLAGGGSLVLLLAGLLGYSRYQAIRSWHRILQRTGASITRETNGFTYSQSLGGRTVFTLHAAKAVQAKDGKYALHDVALTLYRQADGRADHIYGSDFEYDQKTGVARALGEVHMDLQAPGAIRHDKGAPQAGNGPKRDPEMPGDDAAESTLEDEPEAVHVRTSGLVYVRNLGVAATDQDVEFRYSGMECHSRGAEFDSGQSTVRLLADVQVSGQVRGRAMMLTAARADLDRKTNVATLNRAEVRTDGDTASAASAIVHLRPDGSPLAGEANGSVRVSRGTQELTAAHAEARMGEGTTVREARFTGAVGVTDRNPERPLHAHAGSVHALFGPHGSVEAATAEGAAWVQFFDRAGKGPGLRRELSGERIDAEFEDGTRVAGSVTGPGKAQPELRRLKIAGKAWMSGESYGKAAPGVQTVAAGISGAAGGGTESSSDVANLKSETRVGAEALVVNFGRGFNGRPVPQSINGEINTVLEQKLPGRFERRSTGDRLTIQLSGATVVHAHAAPAPAPSGSPGFHLVSATQDGHVLLRSFTAATAISGQGTQKQQTTEGSAQRAVFRAENERLLLTGEVHLRSDDGDVSAAKVELDPQTGDGVAQGQVLATLARAANAASQGSKAPEATHVLASSARFSRGAGTAEFRGTDAQPVRMWQGASQIEAATLLLDQQRSSLGARPAASGGVVRCVFAAQNEAAGEKKAAAKAVAGPLGGGSAGNVLRVSSARLDYTGTTHEALFSGGVRTSGALGEVHSDRATVFLRGEQKGAVSAQAGVARSVSAGAGMGLLGGAVDRVVVSGHVQMEQPGRFGTGEQLLYTAANSSFVLTGSPGKPPHMVDAQQGSITGTTLLFRTGDNTIVAAGDPSPAGKVHERVRTELNLHP